MTKAGNRDVSGEARDRAGGWPSAEAFRSFLARRLGDGWTIEVVARRPARTDGGNIMSVAAVASRSDGVSLHVAHDRGTHSALLSFGDGPRVPFEDVAVAKGEIETGDLIELGIQALKEPPGRSAFDLESTLRLTREWDGDLAHDLSPQNLSMAAKLKDIGEEFATAVALIAKNRK